MIESDVLNQLTAEQKAVYGELYTRLKIYSPFGSGDLADDFDDSERMLDKVVRWLEGFPNARLRKPFLRSKRFKRDLFEFYSLQADIDRVRYDRLNENEEQAYGSRRDCLIHYLQASQAIIARAVMAGALKGKR